MADPRLTSLALSLSKIKHKKYEFYVLSRIIHLLNDPNIKFRFQQFVQKTDGSYALVDLYLPQFKIAIEVDEGHHVNQEDADEMRQKEIELVLGIEEKNIKRIKIESKQGNIVVSHDIMDVHQQIDDCVAYINEVKQQVEYKPWDGLSGYDHYRSTKQFTIEDDTELSSPTEICNCFGVLNPAQRGGNVWLNPKDGNEYLIWWPNENYEDKEGNVDGAWYNKIDDKREVIDETKIVGRRIQHSFGSKTPCQQGQESHYDGVFKNPRPRIVFYRKKNALNEEFYRFVGVFKLDENEEYRRGNTCMWKRSDDPDIELPEFFDPQNLIDELNNITTLTPAKQRKKQQMLDKIDQIAKSSTGSDLELNDKLRRVYGGIVKLKRLSEELHDKIVELAPEKKTKTKK